MDIIIIIKIVYYVVMIICTLDDDQSESVHQTNARNDMAKYAPVAGH